jgi:hypothetical protein
LYLIKKNFHHENPKSSKHEIYFSCFYSLARSWLIFPFLVPLCPGYDIKTVVKRKFDVKQKDKIDSESLKKSDLSCTSMKLVSGAYILTNTELILNISARKNDKRIQHYDKSHKRR